MEYNLTTFIISLKLLYGIIAFSNTLMSKDPARQFFSSLSNLYCHLLPFNMSTEQQNSIAPPTIISPNSTTIPANTTSQVMKFNPAS